MPTPEEILNGLAYAANQFTTLSIIWHIILLFLVVLLIIGKKFNIKTIAALLGIFLLSAGVIAVYTHNPFNAVMFAIAALLFGIYTLKFKPEPVGISWDVVPVIGLVMFLFGFIYPHFLEGSAFYKYFYASPMGLIPCPTLLAFIGITLMLNGFNSKRWMITGAVFGLFYGIFGVLRLGVYLDVGLIAGALILLVNSFTQKQSS